MLNIARSLNQLHDYVKRQCDKNTFQGVKDDSAFEKHEELQQLMLLKAKLPDYAGDSLERLVERFNDAGIKIQTGDAKLLAGRCLCWLADHVDEYLLKRFDFGSACEFLKSHSPDQLKADLSETFRHLIDNGMAEAEARAYVWKVVKWICSNHEYKWENLKDPVQHKAFLFWMKDTFGAGPEEVDAVPGNEEERAMSAAKVNAELEASAAAHAEAHKDKLHFAQSPEDFDAWLTNLTDKQLQHQLDMWNAHPWKTSHLGLRLESGAELRIKAEIEKRRIEGMVRRAVVDEVKGTAEPDAVPKPERGEKAAAFREVLTTLQVTATNQRKMRGRIKAEMQTRGFPVLNSELRAMLSREGLTKERKT